MRYSYLTMEFAIVLWFLALSVGATMLRSECSLMDWGVEKRKTMDNQVNSSGAVLNYWQLSQTVLKIPYMATSSNNNAIYVLNRDLGEKAKTQPRPDAPCRHERR
jgi:hypothetical protein